MNRHYYSDTISAFLDKASESILGVLATNNEFPLEATQRDAWLEEIRILKEVLTPQRDKGKVYFEYAIPRLGRRIDVVALIEHVIFVLEFKVGEHIFAAYAIDQVFDYALDLKNFHETSHRAPIAPILIATHAPSANPRVAQTPQNDNLLLPIETNPAALPEIIGKVLEFVVGQPI